MCVREASSTQREEHMFKPVHVVYPATTSGHGANLVLVNERGLQTARPYTGRPKFPGPCLQRASRPLLVLVVTINVSLFRPPDLEWLLGNGAVSWRKEGDHLVLKTRQNLGEMKIAGIKAETSVCPCVNGCCSGVFSWSWQVLATAVFGIQPSPSPRDVN